MLGGRRSATLGDQLRQPITESLMQRGRRISGKGQQHASQRLLPVGIKIDVTIDPILSGQALCIEKLLSEQRSRYLAPQISLGQGTCA